MSTASPPIFVVEAFTVGNNEAHTGNPAAVCILDYDEDVSDDTKQKIANTMNISATAFVALDWSRDSGSPVLGKKGTGTGTGPGTIRRTIRWFTPVAELPLCGHATLGATKAVLAFLNGETKSKPESGTGTGTGTGAGTGTKDSVLINKIEFQSKFSGILPVEVSPASKFFENPTADEDEFITLNFPVNLTTGIDFESKSKPHYWLTSFVRDALGRAFSFTGSNLSSVVEDVQIVSQHSLILIRLKGRERELPSETIAKVQPDFVKLMEPIGDKEFNIGVPHGVIVTIGAPSPKSKSDANEPDFYSRFFAPFFGVNEDPVCGWAHTVLTPYWAKKLGAGKDKDKNRILFARMSSARGGDLRCQLIDYDHQGQGQGQAQTGRDGELGDKSDDECRVLISARGRIILEGVINI